jgi:hypothetical protein
MSKIAGGIILAALFLAALPWLLISASAVIRFVLLTLLAAAVVAYVGWLIAGGTDSYLAFIAIAGLMLGVWMIIDWVETWEIDNLWPNALPKWREETMDKLVLPDGLLIGAG